MLYLGDKKAFEIYKDSTLIGRIYKGTTKVYDVNPYKKTEELVNASAKIYTQILPRGVYKVAIGGAKGNNISWAYEGAAWGASGGGGAFVEVTFFNPYEQELELVSADSGDSFMKLGGEQMITAGAGKNAQIAVAGTGGAVIINDKLDIISIQANLSGNNGGSALGTTPAVATVSSYDEWGSTNNSSGGIRLEYIRYVR